MKIMTQIVNAKPPIRCNASRQISIDLQDVIFSLPICSCTKGAGKTQPAKWQDAGQALGNDALRGCYMPLGKPEDVPNMSSALQYNEVKTSMYVIQAHSLTLIFPVYCLQHFANPAPVPFDGEASLKDRIGSRNLDLKLLIVNHHHLVSLCFCFCSVPCILLRNPYRYIISRTMLRIHTSHTTYCIPPQSTRLRFSSRSRS